MERPKIGHVEGPGHDDGLAWLEFVRSDAMFQVLILPTPPVLRDDPE